MKRWLVIVVAASLISGVAITAFADKPPADPCSSPYLTGTNDQGDGSTVLPVGSEYEVDGCGFKPGQAVSLEVAEHGECCRLVDEIADAGGRFVFTGTTEWGAYRFRAFIARGHRSTLAAEWWFGSYP